MMCIALLLGLLNISVIETSSQILGEDWLQQAQQTLQAGKIGKSLFAISQAQDLLGKQPAIQNILLQIRSLHQQSQRRNLKQCQASPLFLQNNISRDLRLWLFSLAWGGWWLLLLILVQWSNYRWYTIFGVLLLSALVWLPAVWRTNCAVVVVSELPVHVGREIDTPLVATLYDGDIVQVMRTLANIWQITWETGESGFVQADSLRRLATNL